jgi:hypothetical protein
MYTGSCVSSSSATNWPTTTSVRVRSSRMPRLNIPPYVKSSQIFA